MRYMIMMFGAGVNSMMQTRSKDWIREMVYFMRKLDDDLRAAGELVYDDGLTDGSTAKTVRFKDGAVVVADGPFAKVQDSLIGYWVVNVENEARALEIAKRVVAFTQGPIEVRQCGEEPEV
jgi:hypothetical protein